MVATVMPNDGKFMKNRAQCSPFELMLNRVPSHSVEPVGAWEGALPGRAGVWRTLGTCGGPWWTPGEGPRSGDVEVESVAAALRLAGWLLG